MGNKTECAMLSFVENFGIKYEAVRQAANVQNMYLTIVIFHLFIFVFVQ